jgi:phenylpropionate dioxygenase-like ring-hydroxylating dioxygenase large terminal subunit
MQTAEAADPRIGNGPSYHARNYPLNCWWIAATSTEVTSAPLARRLLDRAVVFYRTASGEPVAVDDRCPHRWAPLSLGRVDGERIVCRYHGLAFDTDGACVRIPSQDRIAGNVRVRAYPLLERYGFVWIWAGDPALANGEAPPPLPFLEDASWHRVDGAMPVRANWLMFKENVLDLTHLSFLHVSTAGVTDFDRPPEVSIDGDIVTFRQTFLDCTLGPLYRDGLDIAADRRMNRFTSGVSVSPALQSNALRIEDPSPAPGARREFRLNILHFATPETMTSSHYWWTMARDHGQPWDVERITRMNAAVFDEDKWMLEAIQRTVDRDAGEDTPLEISVAADRAALAVRHAMARRVAREAG